MFKPKKKGINVYRQICEEFIISLPHKTKESMYMILIGPSKD